MSPRASLSQSSAMKPQRRFQFIDNTDVATNGHNSTQVRRHVMQEYMREKRWEARSQAESEILEQDSKSRCHRTPKSEGRKRTYQRRKKEETKPTKPASPKNGLKPSPQKDVVLLLKKDSHDRSAHHSHATTNDRPFRMHEEYSKFSCQVGSTLIVPKQKFRLDANAFAYLADMLPISKKPAICDRSLPQWEHLRRQQIRETLPGCPSAVTTLSAARTDPFDTLPTRLNLKEQELFDLYATEMPYRVHGFARRRSRAQNWHHDVLIPEAMKSEITFQILILQHAAEYRATLAGLSTTGLRKYHMVRIAQLLEQHPNKPPNDYSDRSVAALIAASRQADGGLCLKQRRTAWQYWRRAMFKIRQRGGPESLGNSPNLCRMIGWHDCLLTGYDGRGSSFYFTTDSIMPSNDEILQENDGRHELRDQCNEFFVFLQCIEQLTSVTKSMSDNPIARRHQPFRHSLFGQHQTAYHMLALKVSDSKASISSVREATCRSAVLITINVAIWEYRHSTNQSEEFLRVVKDSLKSCKPYKRGSLEILFQTLLHNSIGGSEGYTERPWLVGRLLKVAKRLGKESWRWLNKFLWSCLALTSYEGGLTEHRKRQLREEILEAPLVRYEMQQ